jgi:hypothetical protein
MANYRPNMALDREGFKDKLEEHLGGALHEFYKARLAMKNGESEWVVHWLREAKELVERAILVFSKPTRGFKDKEKAFREVTAHLESKDSSYKRSATNSVRRVRRFRLKLSDADTREFWDMVRTADSRRG